MTTKAINKSSVILSNDIFFTILHVPFSPAFQEKRLLQAVQSGILQRIEEVLNWLKHLNNSKDIGKGNKSIMKGSKKLVVTDNHGQIHEELTGHVTVISKRVLQILHQRSTSNQNVLHICCSNPTFVKEKDKVQNILQNHLKGMVCLCVYVYLCAEWES